MCLWPSNPAPAQQRAEREVRRRQARVFPFAGTPPGWVSPVCGPELGVAVGAPVLQGEGARPRKRSSPRSRRRRRGHRSLMRVSMSSRSCPADRQRPPSCVAVSEPGAQQPRVDREVGDVGTLERRSGLDPERPRATLSSEPLMEREQRVGVDGLAWSAAARVTSRPSTDERCRRRPSCRRGSVTRKHGRWWTADFTVTVVGLPSEPISWSPTSTSPIVVQPSGVGSGVSTARPL